MKQFFLILSGLALLTGCSSKNDSVEGPVQSRIRIAPSISRVTGLNFDTGDRIGLTIVKSGANYCENTSLRFDGTVFVSDDLFWYDDSSEKSNLTAYYPYLAEGAPASFTVRADQKLAADHEALSCGQRRKQLLDIVEEKDALRRFVVRISCQHIMDTAGQDLGQALEGLSPHDDGMTHGESLEPLQVIGKVPDETVILADDTVSGTGNNDRKAHTDTSIAILSW